MITETEIRFAISNYDLVIQRFYERASRDYQKELAENKTFITRRGMYADPATNTEGYVDCLPTFQGLTIPEILEQKVQAQKVGKVTLVDVGFGQGNFLLDCRKMWGHHINLVGYGTPKYAAATTPSNLEKLRNSGIQIIEGNIINMADILDPGTADVIVGCHVLQHTHYPPLEALNQGYMALANDGVALFNSVSLCKPSDFPHNDFKPFETCIKRHGYDFELSSAGAAFSRHDNKKQLNVPIYAIDPSGSASSAVIADPDLDF